MFPAGNLLLLILFISSCVSLDEPECPFGSPKIDLADVSGRCDRYWACDDGLISDKYCPNRTGFDPVTRNCHRNAPCLATTSNTKARSSGPTTLLDSLNNLGEHINQAVKKIVVPLLLPLSRMFTTAN